MENFILWPERRGVGGQPLEARIRRGEVEGVGGVGDGEGDGDWVGEG